MIIEYSTVIEIHTTKGEVWYREKDKLGESMLPNRYFPQYARRKEGNYKASIKRFKGFTFEDIYGESHFISPDKLKAVRVAQLRKTYEKGETTGELYLYDDKYKDIVETIHLSYI